jgi:signal transduction histidine kinase
MRRWIPSSLSGQTLAVLVLTLLVSQLIAITIYWKDRHEAVVFTEAHDFADRVVGMADLLHQLPDEWRQDIVRESDGRTFHVTLDPAPDAAGRDLDEDLSGAIAAFLARELAEFPPDRVLVRFTDVPFIPRGGTADSRPGKPAAPVTGRDDESQVFLHISLRLDDAGWLNFVGGMPAGQGLWLMPASGYILSVALGVAAVAMWLVFRVTAPLTAFAHAADRLGRDIQTEPLPETGPIEVAQASQAFNAMQERLRRLLENRTQILAALSHDLKTPVTLLKLRVELMQESEDRTRMLHAIGDM